MITKDVISMDKNDWKEHLAPVTKLSENETNHVPLVECDICMYNFDTLTKMLYKNKNYPTSTDALLINKNTIEFIEFKSGFKQKITKEGFDEDKGKCDIIYNESNGRKYVCREFWKLFYKNQKHERQILIDSIRTKSIESYITLEKKVLESCSPLKTEKGIKVNLTIVIDENETDNEEYILSELSSIKTSNSNCFSQINSALERVRLQKDSAGNDYFYDEVKVVSATDFLNRMNKHKI